MKYSNSFCIGSFSTFIISDQLISSFFQILISILGGVLSTVCVGFFKHRWKMREMKLKAKLENSNNESSN